MSLPPIENSVGDTRPLAGTSPCNTRPTVLLPTNAQVLAESGFDEKYERDYNIFNPINQYRPDNPLNPINSVDPNKQFNPANQYNPQNPLNPANQFSPGTPFEPLNRPLGNRSLARRPVGTTHKVRGTTEKGVTR
jgi:hypothetical protein